MAEALVNLDDKMVDVQEHHPGGRASVKASVRAPLVTGFSLGGNGGLSGWRSDCPIS